MLHLSGLYKTYPGNIPALQNVSLDIPKGVGFIIRTNAEGKSEDDFKRDIHYLISLWKKIHASIEGKKAPVLLHQELGLVERVMRDYVTEESTMIYVDAESVYTKLGDATYSSGCCNITNHWGDEWETKAALIWAF